MPERPPVRTSTRGGARGDAPHARGDGRRPSPSSLGDIERVRKQSPSAKRDGEDDKCVRPGARQSRTVAGAGADGAPRPRDRAQRARLTSTRPHDAGVSSSSSSSSAQAPSPSLDFALRRRDGTEGVRGDASTTTGGELDVRRGARHRPARRRGGGRDVPSRGGARKRRRTRRGRTGEPW